MARYHDHVHRAAELRPGTILEVLEGVDGLRMHGAALEEFLIACEADARGRAGLETSPYPQAEILRRAQRAALSINASTVQDGTLEGPLLGEAIRQARIAAIARVLH